MPRGGRRTNAGRKKGSKNTPKRAPATGATTPSPEQLPAAQPTQPPTENPFELDPRELLFVECYTGVSRFNASDAYLRAGYKGRPGKVSGLAARLIARDRVSQAVAVRLGSRLRTLQMDGDEALEGISRIGRADPRKIFDASGNVIPIVKLDDDTADCIESFEVVERTVPGTKGQEVEYIKKFKFYDKLHARETMAKVAGKLRDGGAFFGKDLKGKELLPRRVIIELDDAQPNPKTEPPK